MSKQNDDVYISSISGTISIQEKRKLLEVTNNCIHLLTQDEFIAIMAVYGQALDRVLHENKME